MARKPVRYAVVSAFTDEPFKGNPAAVCLLEEEKSKDWLEQFAKEVNMPVTSYLTRIHPKDSEIPSFYLRMFNRVGDEVPMCGHATMAAAHAVFTSYLDIKDVVEFSSLSGNLIIRKIRDNKTLDVSGLRNGEVKDKDDFFIEMDLPAVEVYDKVDKSSVSTILNGFEPRQIREADKNYIIIEFDSEEDVVDYQPQFDKLKEHPASGIIITGRSEGSEFDFKSRFFFPRWGINEDIVCGSAHCALAEYWSSKLGKDDFVAHAAHPRGTAINVRLIKTNKRVILRSKALKIMEGFVLI